MERAERGYGPERQDVPKGPRKLGRQCVDVVPGTQREYIALSHRVLGITIHYLEGRSVPCKGDCQPCPVDHASYPPRWQGWIGVQARPFQPIQYLPVTPGAVSENPALVDHRYSLRGCQLIAGRAGATVNTRKVIAIGAQFWESRQIAPAPDTRLFLARLWGLEPADFVHLPDPHWGAEQPPIYLHRAELFAPERGQI